MSLQGRKRFPRFLLEPAQTADDQRMIDRGDYRFDDGRFDEPCAFPIINANIPEARMRTHLAGDGHDDEIWTFAVIGEA